MNDFFKTIFQTKWEISHSPRYPKIENRICSELSFKASTTSAKNFWSKPKDQKWCFTHFTSNTLLPSDFLYPYHFRSIKYYTTKLAKTNKIDIHKNAQHPFYKSPLKYGALKNELENVPPPLGKSVRKHISTSTTPQANLSSASGVISSFGGSSFPPRKNVEKSPHAKQRTLPLRPPIPKRKDVAKDNKLAVVEPNIAWAMRPPSSLPHGNKFKDVTTIPAQDKRQSIKFYFAYWSYLDMSPEPSLQYFFFCRLNNSFLRM